MRKTIGIVAEGPRDYDMITSIIDSITGEEHNHLRIQPQPDANGEFGNGWKGVWKWRETHQDDLSDYFFSISPKLDLLIIHMDGDVARKEKQVHCFCEPVDCEVRENVHKARVLAHVRAHCAWIYDAYDLLAADYPDEVRRILARQIQMEAAGASTRSMYQDV